MTPKDKAMELVERFIYRTFDYVQIDDAKQCALICVEEMINENKSILEMAKRHMDDRARLVITARVLELESVKKEIENV